VYLAVSIAAISFGAAVSLEAVSFEAISLAAIRTAALHIAAAAVAQHQQHEQPQWSAMQLDNSSSAATKLMRTARSETV